MKPGCRYEVLISYVLVLVCELTWSDVDVQRVDVVQQLQSG